MKSSGIGGQALMEGVMMRNGDKYAMSVRKPDKTIQVEVREYHSVFGNGAWIRLPFIRGIFNFVDSLVIGMRSLNFSASVYETEEEDEQEPGKFEKWMEKTFGDKAEKVLTNFVMVVSIILAIGIFVLLPAFLGSLLKNVIENQFVVNLLEGLFRITIFILYVWLISFMGDIKRTYMYHGAEHKCINCIEHGLPLTVENVAKSSRQHKRCGTSFMLIVMVISVLVFMLVNTETIWMRFLSRILLIPVVAGLSYEFLRLAGNTDNKIVNALSQPGLWLQGLTTAEPDDTMIEVGIASVNAVFDWKEWQKNTLGIDYPDAETAADDVNAD